MRNIKTLRDEFALAALTGDWGSQLGRFDDETDNEHLRDRARVYYRMADVMCEVRHEAAKRRRVVPFRRKDDPKPPESL